MAIDDPRATSPRYGSALGHLLTNFVAGKQAEQQLQNQRSNAEAYAQNASYANPYRQPGTMDKIKTYGQILTSLQQQAAFTGQPITQQQIQGAKDSVDAMFANFPRGQQQGMMQRPQAQAQPSGGGQQQGAVGGLDPELIAMLQAAQARGLKVGIIR